MKKTEKIIIGILLLIILIAIIILIINRNKKPEEEIELEEKYVKVLDDGTRVNTSNKLQETKVLEGMEITNLQLTESGNVTLLLATVTNTTQTKQGGYPVSIIVKDKYDNKIVTISAYIKELGQGESTQLSTSATFDYINAYDIEINKKK